jgi:hypothetical protein
MINMSFRLFLEEFKDIFEFGPEERLPVIKKYDDGPIMPFGSNRMLEHLASRKIGVHEGFQDFSNTVQWGVGPGSIRARIGSQYTVYLEKQIVNLEGDREWITKKVFKINTDEYKNYTESVGDAIHEAVSKISRGNIEGPKKDFDSINDLTEEIAEEMNYYANEMFVFEKIKPVNETNAIIVYQVKGGGVGALQKVRSEGKIHQVLVDVAFNEATGIIRIVNTAVVSGDEGTSWHMIPSFFAGMFSPSQNSREIAEAVVTAMKWF